jgi:radical SAM superfamily enzyme YgiQ (UPF0313 family)
MFYNSCHRKRPLKYFFEEVKYLEEKYKLDGVNFSDEVLLLTEDEIEEFARFRKDNNLRFVWGGQTRADAYTSEETLRKMYDAGCRFLLLGIETGSAETRKQINKPMNQDMIKEFVEKCTRAKITTFGSFMVGFPDETEENLKETVKFALSLDLDAFLINYYGVIPKTPMSDKLVAEGRIDYTDILEGDKLLKVLPTLTKNYSVIPDRELKVVKSYFDWLTFTRKKEESQQKNMFIRKAIDVLMSFVKVDFRSAVENIYSAGKTFVTVVFYSHAFPKIRKKYGLYNVNKMKK